MARTMGLASGEVVLRNPCLPGLAEVDALADSGSVHLCLPEPVRAQLKLAAIDSKEVTLADGRRARVPYVGPVEIRLPESVTHIVAKSEAPVPSDCGLSLVPTHTFANCPALDLICVPGAAIRLGSSRQSAGRGQINPVRALRKGQFGPSCGYRAGGNVMNCPVLILQ